MLQLPTDVELVNAAAATYVPNIEPYFEDADKSIRVFQTTRIDDGLKIFAIEGTHNRLGWFIDLFSLTLLDQQGLDHRSLGPIHAGFYASAVAALTRIALVAQREPIAITGHSLGAALALLLTGLLIDLGIAPVKVGAFAPPRVGGPLFVKVATSIPFCAYRWGNDPVTEVPARILDLPDFPFIQVPLSAIGKRRLWAPGCHNITNYVSGVAAATQNRDS